MFAGILFKIILIFIQIMKKMKTVKTTVANKCMWIRNHVSPFQSLVNKDLPVKNIVFTTNIHYF